VFNNPIQLLLLKIHLLAADVSVVNPNKTLEKHAIRGK
jgi:hypothetical protein